MNLSGHAIALIAYGVAGALAVLLLVFLRFRFLPRRLKTDKFALKWKELQNYCRDKSTWPQALAEADTLLDTALKRRKFKGKSMGERMVSAQRAVTNNDAMWYAHNLAKKIVAEPDVKLKEIDVKTALLGFRSALKDIGAIKTAKQQAVTDATTEEKA